MPPKKNDKAPLKLTAGEKKKQKNDNKAKANPEKAAEKKDKNDAKRERRYVAAYDTAMDSFMFSVHHSQSSYLLLTLFIVTGPSLDP
jgi:hypothetical protein